MTFRIVSYFENAKFWNQLLNPDSVFQQVKSEIASDLWMSTTFDNLCKQNMLFKNWDIVV